MTIAHYLKDIGRGKDGARALSQPQAEDLLGQLLDGQLTDLEIGAFCLAMRIKGETAEEMAGFLQAVAARSQHVPAGPAPVVVLPSYNGARKLPVLTPLLAMLLAREGLAVLVHGESTEDRRVSSQAVLAELGVAAATALPPMQAGELAFAPTGLICPALPRLLQVRRVVGLRNSAHSLVKLMNPCAGPSLVVGSYTHPEYRESMSATYALMGTRAMLLRGTEGEPVADPRRVPRMDLWADGRLHMLQDAQTGSAHDLPDLPTQIDAASTAHYTRQVLAGERPVPHPIALQVRHIVQACAA